MDLLTKRLIASRKICVDVMEVVGDRSRVIQHPIPTTQE